MGRAARPLGRLLSMAHVSAQCDTGMRTKCQWRKLPTAGNSNLGSVLIPGNQCGLYSLKSPEIQARTGPHRPAQGRFPPAPVTQRPAEAARQLSRVRSHGLARRPVSGNRAGGGAGSGGVQFARNSACLVRHSSGDTGLSHGIGH